ncbi:MAG TPA: hypothetical protein VE547_16720 [Mycobacteriales bacterium]|nr:hypothetical protein [Mycobacteriales bacterium]
MHTDPWDDDDSLLAVVAEAEAEQAPAELVAEAKAVYTWRTIDAELAALAYDSALEPEQSSGMRGEAATLRTLSYAARALSLELGVAGSAMVGQVVPPQPGRVEVRTLTSLLASVPVDEAGCFTIRPMPSGRFRLYCVTEGGDRILTSWINL